METRLIRVTGDGVLEIDWAKLLRSKLEDLSDEECFVAVSILDAGVKAFDSRLDNLKTWLRECFAGDVQMGSSETFERGGVRVMVTRKNPPVRVDDAALLALLAERKIDAEEMCFRKAVTYELDTARLEQAIASGVFSADEVRSFTKEGKTPAPSVKVVGPVMGITANRLLEG